MKETIELLHAQWQADYVNSNKNEKPPHWFEFIAKPLLLVNQPPFSFEAHIDPDSGHFLHVGISNTENASQPDVLFELHADLTPDKKGGAYLYVKKDKVMYPVNNKLETSDFQRFVLDLS